MNQLFHCKLQAVYRAERPLLEALFTGCGGGSAPLLMNVANTTYGNRPSRLIIIGQQTYGWGGGYFGKSDPLSWLTINYSYGGLKSTPFWTASYHLREHIDPDAAVDGFLWTNLLKCDLKNGRPSREARECSYRLLPLEIRALEPTSVVFFTGPSYDDDITLAFPGVNFVPVTSLPKREIARLRHPGLPEACFRTYHPKYLRLRNKWDLLDTISELCKVGESGTYIATAPKVTPTSE